jgi:hypothetical protein
MDFLGRDAFGALSIPHGNGPFFTCGCYALQSMKDGHGDGYGLAAMRNPRGPVALIGATSESYSAPGQLAAQGLMTCFAKAQAPERLGDYWLATDEGLARGKMDSGTYALLDSADGSGGQETMETARREHLEMWQLLGDPAMRLPVISNNITFGAITPPRAGQPFTVSGALPDNLAGATVIVALQRPLSSSPAHLETVPDAAPEHAEDALQAIVANNERANNYVIALTRIQAEGNRFTATLALPTELPWSQAVVRVSAFTAQECGHGVKLVSITH